MASNPPTPTQYGKAQHVFIKKTREAIKADPRGFFKSNNWRCINPNGGKHDSSLLHTNGKKSTVESFYVKPIAAWAPHLLFLNHVPSCAHCGKKDHVDVIKARWVNSPKILYGVNGHKYLDTLLYPCRLCGRHFSGYNKKSMQHDATLYYGFFTFYLGPRYAVDEQLYRHVVDQAQTQATQAIYESLKRCAYSAYYDDYQMYLTAVGAKKIIARPNKKAKTMDAFVVRSTGDPELDRLKKRKQERQQDVMRVRLTLAGANGKLKTDLDLKSMLGDKKNHNVVGDRNIVPGLGPTKIQRLIDNGIFSMYEL